MDIDSPPSQQFQDPHATHKHILLPGFSASFPLPFRVLFLIGLAQLLWAVNLHVLYALGIDVSWVLDLRERVVQDDTGIGIGIGIDEIELDERDRDRERDRESVVDLSSENGHEELPTTSKILSSSATMANTKSGGGGERVPSSKLHGSMYRLFSIYTLWVASGWFLFHWLANTSDSEDQQGQHESMERLRIIPGLLALGVIVAVAVPWRGVGERERAGFRRAIKRILLPPLNSPVFFSDVILADILTSFAKVLGDMWISTCQIWNGGITQGRVSQGGWSNWVTLAMVSLPYVLRLRQCLLEYYQSSWTSTRPLANALKYFSAFPVIFLSAAQKVVVSEIASAKGITIQELGEKHDRWFGEHRLFRLWLLAVVVNSMYSFYWDVELDWGLALCEIDTWLGSSANANANNGNVRGLLGSPGLGGAFRGRRREVPTLWMRIKNLFNRSSTVNHQRSPCPTPGPTFSPESPTRANLIMSPHHTHATSASPNKSIFAFGLRPTLLLPDPTVYHLFTLIDLVLRFTWSLKLSSHLHTISEIESGVFMMEALELVRRWMWVFVRVEWEAVKMGEMARFKNVPSHTDDERSERAAGGAGGGGIGKVLWTDEDDH